MHRFKPTVVDTIHVLASITVLCLLVAFVIAKHEPEWTNFGLHSAGVLAGSVVLARVINGVSRR